MIVIVTGTPGTGKTTLAKAIARVTGLNYVELGDLCRRRGLCKGYDRRRGCSIIDTAEFPRLIPELENSVVDSHLSHYLPAKSVGLCVVTVCSDLKKLKARLEKRGYSKSKVRENLDAEIFRVCQTEAEEQGHNVVCVDTCSLNLKQCLELVLKNLGKPG